MRADILLLTQLATSGYAIHGRLRKSFRLFAITVRANDFARDIDEHDGLAASQPVIENK